MLSRSERQAATVVLMLIAGVLLILVYLLTNNTDRAKADDRVREEQVARGQQLFAANCATCHGNRGQGGVGLKLDIPANRPTTEAQATQRTEYLTRTLINGRPGTYMPAWALQNGGPLNDEQIGALVAMIEYGNWDGTEAVVKEYQVHNGTPPAPSLAINTGGIGGNPALATVGPIASNVQNPSAVASAGGANAGNASGGAPAQIVGDGMTINATEKDFAIQMDTSLVKPGSVTFHIKNTGPSPHNIAIKELNMTSDTFDPGKGGDFKVDLKEGTYTVICNIPGHEQLGMHVMLKVGNAASAGSVASVPPASILSADMALVATKPEVSA
ncbi:MAG: c-type cytochrome [Chloroflexota bacterium]|nr:c-type cytochrome [Chloroflexota bacterium]